MLATPTADETMTELYALIDLTLAHCTAANTPHVCATQQTAAGRAEIRERMARECIANGVSVGMALLEVEKALAFDGSFD